MAAGPSISPLHELEKWMLTRAIGGLCESVMEPTIEELLETLSEKVSAVHWATERAHAKAFEAATASAAAASEASVAATASTAEPAGASVDVCKLAQEAFRCSQRVEEAIASQLHHVHEVTLAMQRVMKVAPHLAVAASDASDASASPAARLAQSMLDRKQGGCLPTEDQWAALDALL